MSLRDEAAEQLSEFKKSTAVSIAFVKRCNTN